jgi:translation initiation factor 4G
MTFRRVLLNTCQDEFEDAAIARDALRDITDADERAAAEKRVKLATMGNIRLIAELYRKDVVKENILHLCISDLLKTEGGPRAAPAPAVLLAADGRMG